MSVEYGTYLPHFWCLPPGYGATCVAWVDDGKEHVVMTFRALAVVGLALSAACGGTSAGTASSTRPATCNQITRPGDAFPAVPAGHHAQSTPTAALHEFLTVQRAIDPQLAPSGWRHTVSKPRHHTYRQSSNTGPNLIDVVRAKDGWWVGDVETCG